MKKKHLLRLLRKHKRRVENDAYAKDARFWRDQKSADRIGYDRPINKQARKILVCLAVLFCFVPSHGASSAPGCLTKQEARGKYPHSHLYWRTPDHCWGNRSIRFRPRQHFDRAAIYARGQAPTNKDVFDKNPTTTGHKIIDLDTKTKDECCWPLLQYDANGNVVEPTMLFAERIKDVPQDWWKE